MSKKKKSIESTEETVNIDKKETINRKNQIVCEKVEENKSSNKNEKTKEEIKDKPKEKSKNDDWEVPKYNNYEANLKKDNSRKIIIAFSIIGILIFILALFSTMFALANINNLSILDGVTVKGISLTGLTKEEAKNKLTEEFNKQLETDIILQYQDYSETINGEQIDAKYNIDEIVEQAYEIGRNGNIIENNYSILQCLIKGENIEEQLTYNEELLNNLVADVSAKLPGGVTKSSYYIDGKNLIITPGKEGVVAQAEPLEEKIISTIKNIEEKENVIEIPVKIEQPEAIDIEKIHNEIYVEPKDAYYTTNPFTIYPHVEGVDFEITIEEAKELVLQPAEEYKIPLKYTTPTITTNKIGTEAFPDLLSTFSTKYDATNKNRSNNLALAAGKINGTVLLPGEEFSYNKVVGERSIAAGYKEAHIFAGGKVTDGLGGGICQISTTLYDAVLYANLEITERRNHQMPAGYVKNGLDATVVYGSIDFKFVNNRKYPIKIVAEVKNGVAKMSIYGIKEEVEYEVRLEPVVLSYTPFSTEYITDTSLAPGQQVVSQYGSNGCKTVTYKYLYLNGNLVSKTELSRDTYKPINKVIRVGSKNS